MLYIIKTFTIKRLLPSSATLVSEAESYNILLVAPSSRPRRRRRNVSIVIINLTSHIRTFFKSSPRRTTRESTRTSKGRAETCVRVFHVVIIELRGNQRYFTLLPRETVHVFIHLRTNARLSVRILDYTLYTRTLPPERTRVSYRISLPDDMSVYGSTLRACTYTRNPAAAAAVRTTNANGKNE